MAGIVHKFAVRNRVEETEVEEENFRALEDSDKSFYDRVWPVLACGTGLFSDGYLNGVIGSVSTCLARIYPTTYAHSPARRNVSSITFAGTVLGTLIAGYTADQWSRKWSLFICTILMIVFAALGAGAYGAGGSQGGLFAALTAYRFLIGMTIGGEYPAGSVACAESTSELRSGTRNRWFVFATDAAIDFGFVVSAIVPMIVVLATTEDHLRAAWRIMLGIGCIWPIALLYFRHKLNEPEAYVKGAMKSIPIWLTIKFYWFRLATCSLIWFIYDFSAYGFGIYSSSILDNLLGTDKRLWVTFGWNTMINLWYMPGVILGAYVSDWMGPRNALTTGVVLQGIVGFIMAGCYKYLNEPSRVGGFTVVYGLFLALGELGPGANIGLVASKTSATAIRGRYYSVAASIGKVGAFAGTYLFPIIQDNAPTPLRAGQDPFWVASSLAVFAGIVALTCLPDIKQDTIDSEDRAFRAYLQKHGYNTMAMGLHSGSGDTEALKVEEIPAKFEENGEKS